MGIISEGKYILDSEGNPVPEKDLLKWGRWLENHHKECVVKQTQFGPYIVSTVFLAMDHSFVAGPHKPILYETLVFEKGKIGKDLGRYTSKEEALKGHNEMVRYYRKKFHPKNV